MVDHKNNYLTKEGANVSGTAVEPIVLMLSLGDVTQCDEDVTNVVFGGP